MNAREKQEKVERETLSAYASLSSESKGRMRPEEACPLRTCFQRDRDLALLITIGLYALNIIDANVDAHLKQYNVNEDLSLKVQPYLDYHPINSNPNYGLALAIRF